MSPPRTCKQSSLPLSDRTCCFISCQQVTSRWYHYFVVHVFFLLPLPIPRVVVPYFTRSPRLPSFLYPRFSYNPQIDSSCPFPLLCSVIGQSPPTSHPIPSRFVPHAPSQIVDSSSSPPESTSLIYMLNELTPIARNHRNKRVVHSALSPSEQPFG